MDNILLEQLKVVLGTAFALYLKSHNFHWNVEGRTFAQDHAFFGSYYDTVWSDVDEYAEQIRNLGEYAPGSLSRFSQLSKIDDELNIPDSTSMYAKLYADNECFIAELYKLYDLAEKDHQIGLSNVIQGKISWHEKMRWQIKTFLA